MPDELSADRSLKHWLKKRRLTVRRTAATLRWGRDYLAGTPAVLGNAMPKSGSHLIIQILQGLTSIGPFINPGFPPVNRTENNQKLSDQGILDNIFSMKPGEIGYSYLHARPPFVEAVTRPGMAMVFVYRDPRDMIISHIFYATEIHKGHGMHRYYTEDLASMEERINAAICGVQEEGSELSGVNARYLAYLGWLSQPDVLTLRFEELILNRESALKQILDYLGQRGFESRADRKKAIASMEQAIEPKRSGTFRKGKPGNWQEYFTLQNKQIFKQEAGDLLIQLGYEQNNDW
jgi:Sulfotransferase domain